MSEPQQQWTETIEAKHSLFDLKLAEVWRYKDLVYMFVKRDFVSSFKQTILGPVWFFINPILTTIVFVVVFGKIAGLSTDGLPQILFYLSAQRLFLPSLDLECLDHPDSFLQLHKHHTMFSLLFHPRLFLQGGILIELLPASQPLPILLFF